MRFSVCARAMTYWRRNSVQHSVMLPEAQPRRPQRHASRNGSREKQASSTTTFQLEKLVSRSNLNRTCAGSAQFLRSRRVDGAEVKPASRTQMMIKVQMYS
ncbi:PREDICTED: uncharacterized protein LOC105146704 isoform X2 [Acromyrmex echinatior]|uniref:uncharacterized protein LOC105146704 isoform X2 n=1 Tax=Acromyrmex echinatior TaxID=103372 RepID=UPI000580C37C|nr:PREDICTED: uncharacterized protein LOC105146704 isoform X2 [Acromyrmex echinatior]